MSRTGIALSLCILLASAAVAVQQPGQMPVWPQIFSFEWGDHATFGIPNPGSGVVKVKVNWSGGALAIGAVGSDRQVLTATTTRTGTSHQFTIDTTGIDPAKCPVFLVSAAPPKGANAKGISGSITVESPPVPPVRLQQLSSLAAQQPTTTLQTQAASFAAKTRADDVARAQAQNAQMAALTNQMQSAVKTEQTQMTNILQSMASPGPNVRTQAARFGSILGIQAQARPAGPSPSINSASPTQGQPGQQITITGIGLNPNATEVWFTIAAGVDVPANITSYNKSSTGAVTIKAQVPTHASATAVYNGQVYARATDLSPASTTNKLAFGYQPVTAATSNITYIDPVEVGPQTMVQIDGNFFAAGDIVHFVIPGLADYPVQPTVVNSTRLNAVVPLYTSRQIGNGSIYIAKGTTNTQAQAMIFKPTIPVITSIPASVEADTPFLIRGISFGQSGQVHIVDSNGNDSILTAPSWSDTHIMARTPAVFGFTGSRSYQIYVKNSSASSDNKPFSITPKIDHVWMNMNELYSTHDYTCSPLGNGECNASENHPNNQNLTGHHQAGMFINCLGQDTYFNTRVLKNGWTVEAIVFGTYSPPPFTSAQATMTRPYSEYYGSSSPLVKVQWSCDPMLGNIYYGFGIKIKGPKGMAY